MSIFGVILFAFAITLTSCGDAACAEDCASECCVEAAPGCQGGGECLEDHSCCAPAADAEGAEGEETATCCCGDATCDGSCHGEEGGHNHGDEDHSHEGGEEHTH